MADTIFFDSFNIDNTESIFNFHHHCDEAREMLINALTLKEAFNKLALNVIDPENWFLYLIDYSGDRHGNSNQRSCIKKT